MPILKPIRAIQLNKSHLLARSLRGCWLFNEGTGDKIFDLSKYGNIGTLQADTHWVPGQFGSCLSFDGNGDYVDCGSWGVGIDDITVSLWIRGTSTNRQMIFEQGGNPYYYVELNQNVENRITFRIYSAAVGVFSHTASFVVNDNIWHHILVTADRDGLCQIYVDGVAGSMTNADISATSAVSFDGATYIGTNSAVTYPFTGKIDHVMIFNRVFTAGEIAQLYREPFCMFAVTIQPDFLFPAGQIVLLAAASTATSSAYGLLIKHSKLAGIIDTTAALSGILKLRFRGEIERQWLTEALFNGMTANAFKLATVLTNGWFWMRRTGCSALYRGPGVERIDFANILTVAEQDAVSISPPDHIPHNSNLTYFYVVHRFNNCGYQERTLAAAVKVSIDAEGNLVEQKPNNIFAWRLDQVHGNKIQLIWFYCGLEQESKPESFRIYYDSGTGLVDYENPIATINYQGRKFYTYQSDALAAGRYLFAAKAENADGIEDNSLARLAVQLNVTKPDAIDILSAETL